MISLIPNRKTVSDCWEAYSQLCQAAAKDPLLANDNGFIDARNRAHKRWSEAFAKWDGK